MAMTLRLQDELSDRAARYAAEIGISVNALVAVALREYLDQRKPELRMATLARAIAQQVQAGPARGKR
jgi:predicted transcriptional regulator